MEKGFIIIFLTALFLSGCAVVFQRTDHEAKVCFPSWGHICNSLKDLDQ